MIEITNEQIRRITLLLGEVPNGVEKALKGVITRANGTVKTEVVRGISKVYSISGKDIRAETNIKTAAKKDDNGIVGTVSFSGYKIPLYRFNASPKKVTPGAVVSAAVLKENGKTVFKHAFVAQMGSSHIGIYERETKKRVPVRELMGLSTAQMAENSVILEGVEEAANETINKRVEHEITRILSGYGGRR